MLTKLGWARSIGLLKRAEVRITLAALAPDWVAMGFAAVAMVAGLAYLLRSPFLTSPGTTVLTVATRAVAGSSAGAANRLLSTVLGAAVGLAATALIPVPRTPQQPVGNPPAAA